MKFSEFLKTVDHFKTNVNFYFVKKQKISSTIGALFSISIYVLILYLFAQSDFFKRKQPFVVTQTASSSKAQKIQFNEKNIFYFHVADANNAALVDPLYFQITAEKKYLKVNAEGLFEPYLIESAELKLCEPSDVYDPELYYTLGMMNSTCFTDKNFILDGFWDESELHLLYLGLSYCKNETSNGTCKSIEEIDAYFENEFYFGVFHHNSYIDANDYEEPIKPKLANKYQMVDKMLWKKFNIFIKKNEVITDNGWFFADPYTNNDFMFDRLETDVKMRNDRKTNPLFEMFFYAMSDYELCNRRYQNLPDVLGSLMGTANALFFILSIIAYAQCRIILINKIMNSLYNYYNKKSGEIYRNKNFPKKNIIKMKTNGEIEIIKPKQPKNRFSLNEELARKYQKTNPIKEDFQEDENSPEKTNKKKIFSNKNFEFECKKTQKIEKFQDSFVLNQLSRDEDFDPNNNDLATQSNLITNENQVNMMTVEKKNTNEKLEVNYKDQNPNGEKSYIENIKEKSIQDNNIGESENNIFTMTNNETYDKTSFNEKNNVDHLNNQEKTNVFENVNNLEESQKEDLNESFDKEIQNKNLGEYLYYIKIQYDN